MNKTTNKFSPEPLRHPLTALLTRMKATGFRPLLDAKTFMDDLSGGI